MLKRIITLGITISLLSTCWLTLVRAENSNSDNLTKTQEMQLLDSYLKKFYEEAAASPDENIVLSTKTTDIKELPIDFTKSFFNLEKYERRDIPFKVGYAAIDYKMKEENRYAINGINYRVVVFIKKDNKWEVGEIGLVPVDAVAANKLGFGDKDEEEMVKIYKAREQGVYLNREGKVIDKENIANKHDLEKEMNRPGSQQITEGKMTQFTPDEINPYYKRPKTIRVLMTTDQNKAAYDCKEVECIREIDFLDYIQNAFSMTWPKDTPAEAMKAGALAVKMYSWFSIVVDPTSHRLNADVVDNDPSQRYVAAYKPKDEAEKNAIENMRNIFYDPDVAGIGFKDGLSHKLFLPSTTDERTVKPALGFLSRQGAIDLAKEGKLGYEILEHYFEGSDRMEEAVSPLTFFRYARK
jgi:hypothetical protein